MKFTITINTENAAFEDNALTETARILEKLVTDLGRMGAIESGDKITLRDVNGNPVGSFTATA